MLQKPAFWIALVVLSLASAVIAFRLFPHAFPLVQLELVMDRERALAAARELMAREQLGPADYRQAASFAGDSEAQTFVELEGGGKDAYTRMLREGPYAAYTWRVRHFREGQKHETLIRFRPDGQPDGFVEQLDETASGAALTADQARAIAERRAQEAWGIDLGPFVPVEQSQERRPGGRIDHTFTYERPAPTLNEGRYRLRLGASGDRLTEVSHFIRIPEAFTRRYEEMRSANLAIGASGSVAMLLLYVVGGIGVGLFWLLRHRWVITRPPMLWGGAVAFLQLLSALNNWPLLWMSYDTAIPRGTFISQQLALIAAGFVGSWVFFGLSFMAAESLTRRAFGHHPQLWRVWSRRAAASTSVAGQTAVGYLLVAMFFAYEVLLYFYSTRLFGWWTPSEALLHPDVLASYLPWLSAIANSLQAGFWEEALFRAVPIAGAALIGDRFGKRGLFIVFAFVIQAVVFGAGHAPYPTQPPYARPVELLVPSIGFGLLYLWFGLLPGIILHYAFDVVWFALPLFVSTASGIWIDRAMVILLTLVPLGIVLVARVRAGAWLELPADLRNRAWVPATAEPIAGSSDDALPTPVALSPWFVHAWAVAGLAAFIGWLGFGTFRTPVASLTVSREQAAGIAREALAARGLPVDSRWRVLPTIDDGRGQAHRFVWEAGGEERFLPLLGRYLPTPRWMVRVATFDGDVADRAEEWMVVVTGPEGAERIGHRIPESRAAPSLDEQEARARVVAAIQQTFDLPSSALREVSAQPAKLAARTDWTFTFQDLTVAAIPEQHEMSGSGEARIEVEIAGTEVVRVRPFVFVPEDWAREQRGRDTLLGMIKAFGGLVTGALVLAAAVLVIVWWSRGQLARKLPIAIFGVLAAVSLINAVNGWPSVVASFSTAQPFGQQMALSVALALVTTLVPAALVGLAAGVIPPAAQARRMFSSSSTWLLGLSAGIVTAAATAAASTSGPPAWPQVGPLASYSPILAATTAGIPALVMRTIVLLVLLTGVHHATRGWTRRRLVFAPLLAMVAGLLGGAPQTETLGGWLASAALSGAVVVCVYLWLLRHDLSLTPLVMATIVGLNLMRDGLMGAFPGALAGSLLGVALTAGVAWWMVTVLRTARQATAPVVRQSAA